MILIDYPPGALGNFVAQVLTNSINYKNVHPSFHRSTKLYDAQLLIRSEEEFLSLVNTWEPTHDVSVIHSFGLLDRLPQRQRFKIIQIVVNEKIVPYMLNQHLKAGLDSTTTNAEFSAYLIKHFGSDDDQAKRKNYFNQYRWLKTPCYVNQLCDNVDTVIEFDNFYRDKQTFINELIKINPSADSERIYNFFNFTQRPILNKIELYNNIVNGEDQPTDLTPLDLGIIDGLLLDQ